MGSSSFAFGAHGGQQVGGTSLFWGRALLWEGSSKSVIDLTPPGFSGAIAEAAHEGRQVGSGDNPSVNQVHALLWSGTANSFVNLHPTSGFRSSYALGIAGNQQVGSGIDFAPHGGTNRALMWRGTA